MRRITNKAYIATGSIATVLLAIYVFAAPFTNSH
jgi:hypothetical protein